MSEKEFALTLTLKGSSLEEIDNLLVQAAGERLRARMVNPPPGPLGQPTFKAPTPPTVQTVMRESAPIPPNPASVAAATVPTPAVEEDGPKKRGRKPGQKVAPYKKRDDHANGQVEDEVLVHDGGDEGIEDSVEEVPARPAQETQTSPKKIPSAEEVVNALKLVSSKYSVDKARTCLAHFNVKRCGDLSDEQKPQFIAYCTAL